MNRMGFFIGYGKNWGEKYLKEQKVLLDILQMCNITIICLKQPGNFFLKKWNKTIISIKNQWKLRVILMKFSKIISKTYFKQETTNSLIAGPLSVGPKYAW